MKLLSASLIFALLPASPLFPSNLKVTFISVGAGDSALIETPSGQHILLDGGDKDQGTDTVIPLLISKGIRHLDKIILSNNDSDHYSGIEDILKNSAFTVGTFYHSEPFGVVTPSATVLQAQSAGRCSQIVELSTDATPTLDFGSELTVQVLKGALVAPGTTDSRNANSNIIKVTYNQISFLFTGDADDRAMSNVIANRSPYLKSTVMKVPHHASANLPTVGASSSFLGIVKPEIGVVSVGASSFGLPDPETLNLYRNEGISIYRTDRSGNITIETNGVSYSVATSLKESGQKSAQEITHTHVYPNPVRNQSGTIVYHLDEAADSVQVKILTLSGDLVRNLEGAANRGKNFVGWDLKNQSGESVASGLYIALIEAKSGSSTVYDKTRFAVIKK